MNNVAVFVRLLVDWFERVNWPGGMLALRGENDDIDC